MPRLANPNLRDCIETGAIHVPTAGGRGNGFGYGNGYGDGSGHDNGWGDGDGSGANYGLGDGNGGRTSQRPSEGAA